MAALFTAGGAHAAREEVASRNLVLRTWENGPRETYGRHAHDYFKILLCEAGSITFHTGEGDVVLCAGDRLDLEPHTQHAATVGSDGCICAEAWVLDW